MAFTSTSLLREPALYFTKNGKYDCGLKGSKNYKEYWLREKKRCLEGFTTSNGISITGMHYFYLNYCKIQIVEEIEDGKDKSGKKTARRYQDFPSFWDEDYKYFWLVDICRNGITIERLRELEKWFDNDIQKFNLIETEENLGGGKHLCWLKPRGMGASWKGAVIPTHRYFLEPKSKTFLMAEQNEFLLKDGLFNDKFTTYLDYCNTNTEFKKANDFKNDRNKMHVRASYSDNGTEKGYMSEVIGVTLKDDPEKARGKRGYILWEEAGKFKGLESAWNIALKSVEQDGAVFGIMIAFGTGGLDKGNFESLEKMFYDPRSFGQLVFQNVYDEGRIQTECGYFTPAYINPRHKDKDGNSDIVTGKKFLDKIRLTKIKSPNPQALAQEKTEKPFTPSEALLNVENNMFPAAEMQTWKTNIITSLYKNIGINGKLEANGEGIKFLPNSDCKPVLDFPLKKETDLTGCITIYEPPFKREGIIPNNLYFIAVDPYKGDAEGGAVKSLGVAYVMQNINNFTPSKGGIIVGSLIGRPSNMAKWNEDLFNLAEYYNAKVAIESDAAGGLIEFAKAKKKLKYLMPEFTLGFNTNIEVSKSKRPFGVHIGSGKENKRIKYGDKYIDEWLREVRNVTEDGETIYGYHTIYDLGLLEELSRYGTGNFDRVSALRIAMYTLEELAHINTKTSATKSSSVLKTLKNTVMFQ